MVEYSLEVILMKTVGFIGLGTMGKPMAMNLLKHKYPLTVYNRTTEKAEDLAPLGADVVYTPADVARSSDVILTMLSDDRSVTEVYYGVNGIMDGIHPGLTLIDCSTVSPDLSRRLQREFAGHYMDYLDAPVSGSKPAAERGTLVFMVGGRKAAMEEHIDVFQALGEKIFHMGPSGSGSQTKLAINAMLAINLLSLCEGMSMAAKSDLNIEQFMEIALNCAAGSRIAELKSDKLLDHDFTNQFSLKLMLKDLNLSAQLAQQQNLVVPMMHAAQEAYQISNNNGWGDQDFSAVIKCYENWQKQRIARSPKTRPDTDRRSSGAERRKSTRIPMGIQLQLSVYQWNREGSFAGQIIEGTMNDLSDSGLQITSRSPLAQDMFVVIYFPKDAELPPVTGKIIRIEAKDDLFHYGCLLSGLPPYTRLKLESYIQQKIHAAQKIQG